MTAIHVYFVLPQNIENEDECDNEMQQAFNQCQLHKSSALQTEWLTADQCMQKTNFIKTDVIVLHEFNGPVYDKLLNSKATILGPRCLSCCLMEGSPIPPGPHPVFTIAMREHVIAISGLSRQEKEMLKTKIQWMGGVYSVTLMEQCTHVIANNVLSEKYSTAVNANIPIMDAEWVNAVWKASLTENVLGSDPRFKKHTLPPFYELNITTSSLSKSEKSKIMEAVNSNGGTYTGSFLSETTDVLITNRKGTQSDKYKACVEYNKLCLLPSWVYSSVERGVAVDSKPFTVSSTSTSSPNSSMRLPDMSLNFSTITNLRNPGLGSIDESCSSVASSAESTRMTIGSAKKDTTCSQRSRSSRMNAFNKDSAQLVDGIEMKEVRQAGIFLDGCCIYVYGFTAARRDKLHRLVSRAGAIRYDNPQEAVTHAICGDQSASITLKTSDMPRATHVRVNWLIDSMKAGRPIDEHQYSIQNSDDGAKDGERSPLRPSTSSLAANASPMSKRNLQLLQGRPPVPLFSLNSPPNPSVADNDDVPADIMEQYTDKSQTLKAEDDTLMEYVKLTAADTSKSTSTTAPDISAKANVSDCVTRVKITNESDESKANDMPDENSTMTEESQDNNENLFEGMVFELQGIDKPSAEDLIPTILGYGGTVVRRGNSNSTHVVVPVDYDPDDVVNKNVQVVTTLWLSDCQSNEEILEIKYHHRPIRLIPDTAPLAGLTLGISIYESNERTFIDELARLMGAVTQQTFCRRDTTTARASTHLICPTASGPKYVGAVKWGLPAVSVDWLLECAKKGRRVREGPYLIGETNEPAWNHEEDISIEREETTINGDNEKENFTHNENSPLALPLDNLDRVDIKTDSKKDSDPPIQRILSPENNTPKGKHAKLSIGGGMLSPASRYIAMARQGLLGSDTQETPKRSTEDDGHTNPNETMSTPPMDNALATPNLALFSPTTRRRLQAIKRGEMPSNPPKTPRNPFEMMDIATPESPFGAALRPETGHMSVESRKKLSKFCNNLPLPSDTCEQKRTPIGELTKRFCSAYQNGIVTPLKPRQLHISDDEETPPPSKQRKTSEMQSPSGNKTHMTPALENKLKQLDSILTGGGGNITATTPSRLLGKRSMRTPPSHTKIDQQNMEPIVKSGCGESQTDTVGWDDMSVSGDANKTSSSNQIPPVKLYKFIFSTNVSNRGELEQIIKRLGGTVVEEVDSTATHTLCNKPNRSEKVMASIAAGVLLIHPSYISRSQEAGRFLDENPFVWGSSHAETQVPSVTGQEAIVSMAALRWHAKIRDGNPPPFHNLTVIVHVSPDKRPPLVKLLVLGGAILLDDSIPPKKGETEPTCCIAELPKRPLSPDALKYLVDNRIPLCPSTYLAKLLMEENLEPAMHYAYPDFRRMLEES